MQNIKFYGVLKGGGSHTAVVRFNRRGFHQQERGAWPFRGKGEALTQRQVEDVMYRKGFTRTKVKEKTHG